MRVSRNAVISLFVVAWLVVFHYETLRLNYLSPLAQRAISQLQGRPLPKLKFLFPPAGWIMFFNVDRSYGFTEVYGILGQTATWIDPHRIFQTRAVGYDNIHRNVLVGVLLESRAPSFCRYLRGKFPAYESFGVVYAEYPDVVASPELIRRAVAYRCASE